MNLMFIDRICLVLIGQRGRGGSKRVWGEREKRGKGGKGGGLNYKLKSEHSENHHCIIFRIDG